MCRETHLNEKHFLNHKYADTPAVIASKRMLDAAGVRYYKYNRTGRKITIEV